MSLFGDVAGALGLGGSDYEGMSQEERELVELQRDLLQRQTALQEDSVVLQTQLQRILLESAGFNIQYDDNGRIVGISGGNDGDPLLRDVLQEKLFERSLAALQGDLPADPALMRDLREREQQLTEQLAKDFGSISAGRTSSAGIERLTDFEQFRYETLDSARRKDINDSTQLALAVEAGGQNRINQLLGITQMPQAGFNNILSAAAGVRGQYTQDRQFAAQLEAGQQDRLGDILGIGTGIAYGRR